MKKGSRRTDIRAQERERITGLDTRCPELSARPRDAEQVLNPMSQGPNILQKLSDIVLGRNRNFVGHEIPELSVREGKQRAGR